MRQTILRQTGVVFKSSLALWVSPHDSTTPPVPVCALIPALGGTEQGRQQKFVKTSTEKYVSTTEKVKGSQLHRQQIEFHWRHKWTQEKELHIVYVCIYTERDTTALYGANTKNVCIFE